MFPKPLAADSPLWDACGIYMITAPAKPGEFSICYVGRTYGKTRSFRVRFDEHLKELRDAGKRNWVHKTTRWQYHFNKYGDVYSLTILEVIEPGASMDYVNERESWHIQHVRDRLGLPVFNSKHHDGAGFNGLQGDCPEWLASHAAANRKLAADPKWLAANAAGVRKRSADPEWRAAISARSADPEWREANAVAMRKLATDPSWRAANAAANAARFTNMTSEQRAAHGRAISAGLARKKAEREAAALAALTSPLKVEADSISDDIPTFSPVLFGCVTHSHADEQNRSAS